jgi:hypothetical protein
MRIKPIVSAALWMLVGAMLANFINFNGGSTRIGKSDREYREIKLKPIDAARLLGWKAPPPQHVAVQAQVQTQFAAQRWRTALLRWKGARMGRVIRLTEEAQAQIRSPHCPLVIFTFNTCLSHARPTACWNGLHCPDPPVLTTPL